MLNVVLIGTGLLACVLLALLLVSVLAQGHTEVVGRVVVAAGGVGFTAALLWLSRRLHYKLAAYALTTFYFLLAIGSVASWGIGNTFGILLLGLSIILASIVLSARHGLYATALAAVALIGVQTASEAGWITVPTTLDMTVTMGNVISIIIIFGLIAVISWLFGARMEHSLAAAEAAEAALEHEKSLLQTRLQKYAQRLQRAQVDEMRQLYQFAEVGQLSTSLLHDLANHLSVLNLEIGGMHDQQQSQSLSRSRAIVAQLDMMLDEVRNRLAGQKTVQPYSLVNVISEAVLRCLRNYPDAGVQIDWRVPANTKPFDLVGDPLKCSQIIAILLRNACDAYAARSAKEADKPARIEITVKRVGAQVQISITDWSVGIPADKRQAIFRPAYTTKRSGMGIGLYLARQMAITEFSGSLRLSDATDRTEFIITLAADGR